MDFTVLGDRDTYAGYFNHLSGVFGQISPVGSAGFKITQIFNKFDMNPVRKRCPGRRSAAARNSVHK